MGRKSKNMGYQFTAAITACTYDGKSKRAYKQKHNGETDWHVFGYSYKNDLCETGKNFASWIHSHFPDVKLARDVKPYMAQQYMEEKARSGLAKTTVEKLYVHLRKLDQIIAHRYGNGFQMDAVSMPDMEETKKVRDKVVGDVDYKHLADSLHRSRSDAYKSVVLSYCTGCRIEETVSLRMDRFTATGGRWGYGTLTILKGDGSKGNRPRVIDLISADDRKAVQEIVEGLQPGQLIVRKKDGSAYDKKSVTRTIARHMEKLGMDYTGNRNHALRKRFSQRCYDLMRRKGVSRLEALGYVNRQLGHSENRKDLSDVYVAYQW